MLIVRLTFEIIRYRFHCLRTLCKMDLTIIRDQPVNVCVCVWIHLNLVFHWKCRCLISWMWMYIIRNQLLIYYPFCDMFKYQTLILLSRMKRKMRQLWIAIRHTELYLRGYATVAFNMNQISNQAQANLLRKSINQHSVFLLKEINHTVDYNLNYLEI